MKIKEIKLNQWYCPIERRDDESRIVEGYTFVNEEVGDGYRLTRAAMEAASSDFMRFANVREMHQPNAIGVVESLTWDDTGCLVRVKVVCDKAWEKVKSGVLKGFSVGAKPVISRGKTVLSCIWSELSLVDRPFDPGALFIQRAETSEITTGIELEDGDADPTEAPSIYRTIGLAFDQAGKAQSQIAELIQRNAALESEIETLKAQPDPGQQRPFLHDQKPEDTRTKSIQRMQELNSVDWASKSEKERRAGFQEIQRLKLEIG